ncbi:cache domain-containing protein [Janthinobacterium agaricidamnosum]|uniref:Cache, type 2 domain protein n=1 Tax=Janthinobacterium agaricidamnosum NBRC 102515 = DSM 9628 TaxID=1349767 RepID=W0V5J0_9BURK|nr:cache domain-containing protein [Janthinobacterium agaricidamnosum]CDG83151.1 cache, type 2 domain protein [Janthinobacterium agaricidamnosum NBRC 102515 = DSM 9628]
MSTSINTLFAGVALALFSVSAAFAADTPSSDPAVAIAMVDKGAAFLKKNGKEALITAINGKHPEFVTKDTYLTLRALDGTQLAHPTNPKLVGKNMVVLPDADGKLFRKEIIEEAKTKGKGWVDYRYNNPTTGVIEKKSTYFFKDGDVILEAGIYKGK